MVAPLRLGQSAHGGNAASKGWSQVAQNDAHCDRLRSNPKIPSKTVEVVGKPGHAIQASYQDHGFHSRKATRKEHAPKCRSKVDPGYHYKSNRKCPPKYKKTPNHMKRFSKKYIDREVHSFKKQDWKKRSAERF